MTRPRIAILGIDLESNSLAPTMAERDFREGTWLEGEALLEAAMKPGVFGFGHHLSKRVACEIVPILLTYPEAGGPCDHRFFLGLLDKIERELRAQAPLDGVYIHGHGAGTTTRTDDLDGFYFRRVRRIVGPDVPIVALLDLHGHVSEAMADAADALVAFRTNPHVDVEERVAECAHLMELLLGGARPVVSLVRVPLLIPQVMQLTASGEPYGELMAVARGRLASPVLNISVLSGFPLSDARRCGMSVVVTSLGPQAEADAVATDIARRAWDLRARFALKPLCSVAQAAKMAKRASADPRRPPLLFADIADNPGGGGRGNTTWLLAAFLAAGVRECQFGLFYDPALVSEAHALGEGARFRAGFNRAEPSSLSTPLEVDARVVALVANEVDNRRGVGAGKSFAIGPSALLEIEGNYVAVSSYRQQLLGPDFLTHFGLDPARARAIVVKSRGHFRAGFAEYFSPEQIVEVEAPGIVAQNLREVAWQRLRRPIFPLDADVRFPDQPPYHKRRPARRRSVLTN